MTKICIKNYSAKMFYSEKGQLLGNAARCKEFDIACSEMIVSRLALLNVQYVYKVIFVSALFLANVLLDFNENLCKPKGDDHTITMFQSDN